MEQNIQIKTRQKRKKPCFYCLHKTNVLNYKVIDTYKKFITDRGKIYPRRNSALCAKHQRMLAEAIKRARYIGLIPHCID